jgi:hypothetical protein
MENRSGQDVLSSVEGILNKDGALLAADVGTVEAETDGIGWECKVEVDPFTGKMKLVCGIKGTF